MKRSIKLVAGSLFALFTACGAQAQGWYGLANSWDLKAKVEGPRGPAWGYNATAVGLWRDWAVVGFPGYSGGHDREGQVQLLKRAADGTWQLDSTLNPYLRGDQVLFPIQAIRSWLGYSVSLCNDNLVAAGAPRFDNGAGAAYVFERSGATWVSASLPAGNLPIGRAGIPEQGPLFGQSVAVSGIRVLVGAPGLNRVYVFIRQALGTWALETQLNGPAGSYFGASVSLSGDRAMIGAPREGGGAVYMYERTAAGGWQSVRTFRRNGVGDYLGFSVCMDGTSGVAGMPLADGWLGNEVVEDAGEAIFYCKNPNWVCEEDISPSLPRYENVYGGAVSLSGNRAAVAAPGIAVEERDLNDVFLYERTGHDWRETQRLTNVGHPALGFQFGESLALRNARMIIGGQNRNAAGDFISAAYVYEMSTTGSAVFSNVCNTTPQVSANTPSILQNSVLEYTVTVKWFSAMPTDNPVVVELWDVRNIKLKTDSLAPSLKVPPSAVKTIRYTPTAGNMPHGFKVYHSRALPAGQRGAEVTIQAKWVPYEP